ncbi:MAG TPA: endolytic transglycosylase MltG [Anaerolineae bacterium]|nr:endolytic transglycosylase MltG [Anaerolineae bacterium]HQI83098.1 endolytic transglycosylase MltG [Anaerolineae bacterium]
MKRGVIVLSLLLATFVLLGCSLESLYLSFYIESKSEELAQPAGTDNTPVRFTVEPGESVAQVAGDLKAQGLITDNELFRRYVQYKGLDAGIQAGTYTLHKAMTIPEIARALQKAEAQEQQVTIPEGKRLEEVAEFVASQTTIPADMFLQMAQTGWQGSDLPQTYGFLAHVPITGTLEGLLFPDTYRLPLDATAYDLIDRMLANFARQVTPEIQQQFTDHGLSFYEGIALASIVEREAVIDDERPVIAGVFYNRLRDGWPLSSCPTVQYALGYRPDEQSWWKRQLFFGDLEVDSPYNTYRHQGLPPAPIANPGLRSIQAAANPAETEYYFFMVDCVKNDGSHFFARTEAEHLVNFEACGGVISTP